MGEWGDLAFELLETSSRSENLDRGEITYSSRDYERSMEIELTNGLGIALAGGGSIIAPEEKLLDERELRNKYDELDRHPPDVRESVSIEFQRGEVSKPDFSLDDFEIMTFDKINEKLIENVSNSDYEGYTGRFTS
jgi:hypothetical protein